MPAPAPNALRVDIVSDVVCPWCVIGYLQLSQAADALGIPLDVHWHPFELNPTMAEDGQNLFEHLSGKYGITADQSAAARAQLRDLGQDLGFDFAFAPDMMMWNTFRAHQLIDWADTFDKAHETKLALFAAHFTHRQNISDPVVLARIAAQVGLDPEAALTMLTEGSQAEQVREKLAFWIKQGVQGVPTMLFAAKYATSGAQGVEGYRKLLGHLVQDAAG